MQLPAPDMNTSARHRRGIATRLFVTVWLVYSIHFATNVVRETYLAITLGERLSARVDEYQGLHPDLFYIPGRGSYINSNPGASMLGAMPYAVARPFVDALLRARPHLAGPKAPARYDDPRPNRTRFMNEARRRGLDVKLGLAAAITHAGVMVPLGALAAVVLFRLLAARLRDERTALWLALLYTFGTPVFFRSAFLNQNAILAHLVLFAYTLLSGLTLRRRPAPPTPAHGAKPSTLPPASAGLIGAGVLLGFGIVCDYSGVAIAVVFGLWVLWTGARDGGLREAFRRSMLTIAGAAGPLAVLLLYQWLAFGNPLLPAQAYMPPTRLSVHGWYGFTAPSVELLTANLFDPAFGLLVFCPMLAAAVAAPFVKRRPGGPGRDELILIFAASGALLGFASSVQFAALQFNTGVRYMVPAVPLLFLALVPVLLRMPSAARIALVLPSVVISWSVSMMRESVPVSLAQLASAGPELPWLTVLHKTSGVYAPAIARLGSPVPVFILLGIALWLLWRNQRVPSGAFAH